MEWSILGANKGKLNLNCRWHTLRNQQRSLPLAAIHEKKTLHSVRIYPWVCEYLHNHGGGLRPPETALNRHSHKELYTGSTVRSCQSNTNLLRHDSLR
jgi:hypothetical protein